MGAYPFTMEDREHKVLMPRTRLSCECAFEQVRLPRGRGVLRKASSTRELTAILGNNHGFGCGWPV